MTDATVIAAGASAAIAKAAGIPAPDLANTPAVPPLLNTLAHDYAQKALTAASIWAMTHGAGDFVNVAASAKGVSANVLTGDMVQFGVGAAGIAMSCAWTLGIAYLRKQKMTALLTFIPPNT